MDHSVVRYQPSSRQTAFKDKKGKWSITPVDMSEWDKNYMPGLWLVDLLSMSFCCMTVAESTTVCTSYVKPTHEIIVIE